MTTSLMRASYPVFLLSLLLLYAGNALPAGRQVITDDGREVLLNENGTWEFRSNDRFANTEDGRRVRLKDDGSWQYVGNAPMATKTEVRTNELEIKLQRAVIEVHEQRVQKNTRVKSQTVFYLDLKLSPLAERSIKINNTDVELITIKDNRRRVYPVLSIQPSPATIEPYSETMLVIRADGSPQWWKSVKTMELVFNTGIFGIREPITLSQNVDEIEKKKVDKFESND
jgi:hypothetical protein